MKLIKLTQQRKITVYDPSDYNGKRIDTVFDFIFISSMHIVKVIDGKETLIELVTGEKILVKETPAEIIEKLAGQPDRGGK